MVCGVQHISWVCETLLILMKAPWKVGSHDFGLNRTWISPQKGRRPTNCYFQSINKIFYLKDFIYFVLYLLQYINRIQSLFYILKTLKTNRGPYNPIIPLAKDPKTLHRLINDVSFVWLECLSMWAQIE